MTTVIKLKRGTTTPTTSDIVNGEVAIDTSAQKFYVNDSGTVKEIGGGSSNLDGLSDVSITTPKESQYVYYDSDSSTWKNEYKYNVTPNVPFTLNDGTEQYLNLVNTRDLTSVQGFLNHVVTQSYYLPFAKNDGTNVTTLVLG